MHIIFCFLPTHIRLTRYKANFYVRKDIITSKEFEHLQKHRRLSLRGCIVKQENIFVLPYDHSTCSNSHINQIREGIKNTFRHYDKIRNIKLENYPEWFI